MSLKLPNLREMAIAQNELQIVTLGDNWEKLGHRYRLQVVKELCEAAESAQSDWWKKSEPDLKNLAVEFIDALHFAICEVLSNKELSINGLIDRVDTMSFNVDWTERFYKENTLDSIESTMRASLNSNMYITIASLLQSLFNLNYTGKDIESLYIGKCVLNTFRQNNGYKDGSYVKLWDGKNEDNVFMKEIVDNMEHVNLGDIQIELERKYNEMVKG